MISSCRTWFGKTWIVIALSTVAVFMGSSLHAQENGQDPATVFRKFPGYFRSYRSFYEGTVNKSLPASIAQRLEPPSADLLNSDFQVRDLHQFFLDLRIVETLFSLQSGPPDWLDELRDLFLDFNAPGESLRTHLKNHFFIDPLLKIFLVAALKDILRVPEDQGALIRLFSEFSNGQISPKAMAPLFEGMHPAESLAGAFIIDQNLGRLDQNSELDFLGLSKALLRLARGDASLRGPFLRFLITAFGESPAPSSTLESGLVVPKINPDLLGRQLAEEIAALGNFEFNTIIYSLASHYHQFALDRPAIDALTAALTTPQFEPRPDGSQKNLSPSITALLQELDTSNLMSVKSDAVLDRALYWGSWMASIYGIASISHGLYRGFKTLPKAQQAFIASNPGVAGALRFPWWRKIFHVSQSVGKSLLTPAQLLDSKTRLQKLGIFTGGALAFSATSYAAGLIEYSIYHLSTHKIDPREWIREKTQLPYLIELGKLESARRAELESKSKEPQALSLEAIQLEIAEIEVTQYDVIYAQNQLSYLAQKTPDQKNSIEHIVSDLQESQKLCLLIRTRLGQSLAQIRPSGPRPK